MPQAKTKSSMRRRSPPNNPIPAHILKHGEIGRIAIPASAELPPDPGMYALAVDGECLAPFILHEDRVLISPAREAKAGDFVHIAGKNGKNALKRLTNALPPRFERHEGDEVDFLVCCETLNPPHFIVIPAHSVASVYPCVGLVRNGEFHSLPWSANND